VLVPGERLGPRTYPRVWSACVDTKSVGPPRSNLTHVRHLGHAPGGGNRILKRKPVPEDTAHRPGPGGRVCDRAPRIEDDRPT
jgi:hypothetical protein